MHLIFNMILIYVNPMSPLLANVRTVPADRRSTSVFPSVIICLVFELRNTPIRTANHRV